MRLDTEEQEKIAKSGLEMKLITSEMDAETEKWQESNSNTQLEVGKKLLYLCEKIFGNIELTQTNVFIEQ